jgi:hypothetical protein
MDIQSFRLGLAYGALKQAFGEDCAPLSFSTNGMAFIDRRGGSTFFCLAGRDALWIGRVGANGVLGDGLDADSQRLRSLAEPGYLARSVTFEREQGAGQARERRAAEAAQAPAPQAASPNPAPPARADVLSSPQRFHRQPVVRGAASKT